MTTDSSKLAGLAREQCGLFTRRQARACGYSDYQVRRRIEAGIWQVMLGPVLASSGVTPTPRLLDRAAGLAVPGGVLAGPSAARMHGIPIDEPGPWLTLPASAHPRLPFIGLLRGPLSTHDVVMIEGLVVTGRSRTVFDCLRVLPEPRALDLLDRALQRRWTTLDDLVGRVRGFTGRPRVGRLVKLVATAGSGARSAAERLAIELLDGGGVEGWQANAPIHDARGELIGLGDLVFRAERVVVELDGRAFHVTADASSGIGTGRTS